MNCLHKARCQGHTWQRPHCGGLSLAHDYLPFQQLGWHKKALLRMLSLDLNHSLTVATEHCWTQEDSRTRYPGRHSLQLGKHDWSKPTSWLSFQTPGCSHTCFNSHRLKKDSQSKKHTRLKPTLWFLLMGDNFILLSIASLNCTIITADWGRGAGSRLQKTAASPFCLFSRVDTEAWMQFEIF
jgi:hypothetical protein